MPEAITKYAVNNTLGTEDFKPLNMLLIDEYRKSFRYIPNPDGDKLAHLKGTYAKSEDSIRYSLIFKPQISGRILVKTWIDNDIRYTKLEVYEEDKLIFSDPRIREEESDKEIPIIKDKEYKFNIENTNNKGSNVDVYLELYGTVIIGGFFETSEKTEIL